MQTECAHKLLLLDVVLLPTFHFCARLPEIYWEESTAILLITKGSFNAIVTVRRFYPCGHIPEKQCHFPIGFPNFGTKGRKYLFIVYGAARGRN